VLDELDDADARRQIDQPLLEPEEQVIDLGGLRLRLFGRDGPNGERVSLALVEELAISAVALLLERSHDAGPPGNATPISAQRVQKKCRRSAFCTIRDSP
jgi:hypothetical protein